MRNHLVSLLFLICGFLANAQRSFSEKVMFLEHLERIEAYNEAFLYLNQFDQTNNTADQLDTLNFVSGRLSYLIKDRQNAVNYFDKVSVNNNKLFNASRFYSGLQLAYLNNIEGANSRFDQVKATNQREEDLRNYELAAVALLNRNFEDYSENIERLDSVSFHLSDQVQILNGSFSRIRDHKRKSPLVAGLMSAIIPGSGKMYIGQYGRGIMSLVASSIFGLQAYEGYRKNGANSTSFIAFSSIFGLFHIANIYGTVVAVRVNEANFNDNENKTILLRMHIPIRLLYD